MSAAVYWQAGILRTTTSCSDPIFRQEVIDRFQEMKERIIDYNPYPDEEVIKAVKTTIISSFDPSYNPKISWLSDVKPRTIEDLGHAHRCYLATDSKLRDITWDLQRLASAGRDLWFKNPSWNTTLPQGSFYLDDEIRKEFSHHTVNLVRRRTRQLVTSAGAVSSRMRRKIGAFAVSQNSWPTVTQAYHDASRWYVIVAQDGDAWVFGDYLVDVCNNIIINTPEKLEAAKVLAASVYALFDIGNEIVLVEKPQVAVDDRNMLHRTDGPAIRFPRMGWEAYCVNNVRLNKRLVMSKPEDIPAEEIIRTRNVEVRREIVRKKGIDTILKELDTSVLDEEGDYVLVKLDLRDGRSYHYLKMINPSLNRRVNPSLKEDVYHIEGVPSQIRTVAQALEFRNGTAARPAVLT